MRQTRSISGVRQILVVVGAVFAGAMPSAGEATADGPVAFKSRLGDVCLDAPNGGWPSNVMINPCNGTDFQRWNVTGDQKLESVVFPGRCLTMSDGAGAANLKSCLSTSRWNIQPDGQITAVFGPCLTVLGGPGPGTLVSTRFCNGGPEQGWDTVS
jgi:Ricin-type beta-trefoil lectin domain